MCKTTSPSPTSGLPWTADREGWPSAVPAVGVPRVRPGRRIKGGDRGGRVEVLTGMGDDGEQSQSYRRRKARRPARVPMDGDAPANLRPKGGAEDVQLGEAKCLVGSVAPVRHPRRRTGRRPVWSSGGGRIRAGGGGAAVQGRAA
jgi:hypothetical protein